MKLALFGLCSLLYVLNGSMAQVLPHYNGIVIALDQKTPYVNKISSRVNTAFITSEQRAKEGAEILHLAENNFRQCEQTFGGNPTLIGSLKGCFGRFTGMAMSQISALEGLNRNNAANDPSLLLQNSNLRSSNLRLQNGNFNSQLTNKYQSNENLNHSNSRFRNNESNEQKNLRSRNNKKHDSDESNEQKNLRSRNNKKQDSDESNEQKNLRSRKNKNQDSDESYERKSNSQFNSRNKHSNKHRETNENKKDRDSNESY